MWGNISLLVAGGGICYPLMGVLVHTLREGDVWAAITQALTDPEAVQALKTTVMISAGSSTLLVACMCFCIFEFLYKGRRWLNEVFGRSLLMTGLLPEPIFALSVAGICLWVKYVWGVELRSYSAVICVDVFLMLSASWYMVREKLQLLDQRVMDSAQDLGASDFQGMWTVQMPQMLPILMSVWAINYLMVADDFLVSLFVGGGEIVNAQSYVYVQAARSSVGVVGFTSLIGLANLMIVSVVLLGAFLLSRRHRP